MKELEESKVSIEKLRKQLHNALEQGEDIYYILKISQQLDKLINRYQQMLKKPVN